MSNCFKELYFKKLGDEDGHLVVIEGDKDIPFNIKRVFYIFGTQKSVIRGRHANKESEFVLINVHGKSKVKIDDGSDIHIINLDEPNKGVYIKKMVWKDMYDFSDDAVLLVLASTEYNDSEYIRDYTEYKRLCTDRK